MWGWGSGVGRSHENKCPLPHSQSGSGPDTLSAGNHVVFIMVKCTDKWPNFEERFILSGGKKHFLYICQVLFRE